MHERRGDKGEIQIRKRERKEYINGQYGSRCGGKGKIKIRKGMKLVYEGTVKIEVLKKKLK